MGTKKPEEFTLPANVYYALSKGLMEQTHS